MVMRGDVRASDAGREAAAFPDPWLAAGEQPGGRPYLADQARQGLARLRRRVLLALAVVTVGGVALVSLLAGLVLFHVGWLGIALAVLLGLGASPWPPPPAWPPGLADVAPGSLAGSPAPAGRAALAQPRGVGRPPDLDGSLALAAPRPPAPRVPLLRLRPPARRPTDRLDQGPGGWPGQACAVARSGTTR